MIGKMLLKPGSHSIVRVFEFEILLRPPYFSGST